MFGKLFGSSKKTGAPQAPPEPKLRKVNIDKRFSIIGETGLGSMSKVYRAMDNQTGRNVCLKVQDRRKTAAAVARSAAKSYRPTEGVIAVQIVHPHVVKTYEYGMTTKGEYFIVMEWIDGVSLIYVRQSRTFDLASRVELLAQSAEGLAAVHAAGFIHHDFGPKNLLVTRDDHVKLIDFGLAVPNTPEYRRPGNRTGTLQYMSPELIRREPTDERLDIFSWGVMAFEFLTNRLPYDATDAMGMMRQRVNSTPMEIQRANPRLPMPLCAIINKTLVRRKDDRWPKMSNLAAALRELAVESR
jgi:serine/threonine protein kinase